jgi:hypothetical protein
MTGLYLAIPHWAGNPVQTAQGRLSVPVPDYAVLYNVYLQRKLGP